MQEAKLKADEVREMAAKEAATRQLALEELARRQKPASPLVAAKQDKAADAATASKLREIELQLRKKASRVQRTTETHHTNCTPCTRAMPVT